MPRLTGAAAAALLAACLPAVAAAQPAPRPVTLAEVRPDQSDFRSEYDPSHPAANAEGYVLRPNVDTLVEAMDMREAQRAYEANLNVIETARSMDARTLDLLKK